MIISTADKFIRFRLYQGVSVETVYRQVVQTMRIPVVNTATGADVTRDVFSAHYQNLPTKNDESGGKIRADYFILGDDELTPEEYLHKYSLKEYMKEEGSLEVAKAAYIWTKAKARIALCATLLKGLKGPAASYEVENLTGVVVSARGVEVFEEFFWDTGSFSEQEMVMLLSLPQIAEVPREAAGVGSFSDIGLETEAEHRISRIRRIKEYAYKTLEQGYWDAKKKIRPQDMKTLVETYFLAEKNEQALMEVIPEERDSSGPGLLLEDTINRDGIETTDYEAVQKHSDLIIARAERAQREEELDFVLREGLMPGEQVEQLRWRLEQGEDIGLEARNLMNDFLERKDQGSGDILDEL